MNIQNIQIGDTVRYTGPSINLFDRQATVRNVFRRLDIVVIDFEDKNPGDFHACVQHIEPVVGAEPANDVALDDRPAFFLHGDLLRIAGATLVDQCHGAAKAAGWYTDLKTGLPKVMNVGERLMLVVTEISEGMEGHRKNKMDDHLPHRKNIEVELADAVIRIGDLCGDLGLDLGGAIAEKMAYNATRADHRPEARLAAGGKSC